MKLGSYVPWATSDHEKCSLPSVITTRRLERNRPCLFERSVKFSLVVTSASAPRMLLRIRPHGGALQGREARLGCRPSSPRPPPALRQQPRPCSPAHSISHPCLEPIVGHPPSSSTTACSHPLWRRALGSKSVGCMSGGCQLKAPMYGSVTAQPFSCCRQACCRIMPYV